MVEPVETRRLSYGAERVPASVLEPDVGTMFQAASDNPLRAAVRQIGLRETATRTGYS